MFFKGEIFALLTTKGWACFVCSDGGGGGWACFVCTDGGGGGGGGGGGIALDRNFI